MSTAIMSQNAMYEFGDNLLKNGGMSEPATSPTGNQSPTGSGSSGGSSSPLHHHHHNHHHHHSTTATGVHTSSAATAAAAAAVHLTLSRMQSAPTGHPSAAASMASQQAQLAALLGNLTQHHHNHQQQPQQHQHRRLERTQSAPAPQQLQIQTAPGVQQQPPATANTSRYKTELCRPFEEFGVCKYGDKCQFAHGQAELRSLARHPKYKTELCRTYHTVGFCPYGPRCHFVHNQDEVAYQKPSVNPTSVPVSVSAAAAAAAAAILTRSAPTTAAPIMMGGRPRPAALSPSLSLDSPSPPCSLSQSPASSMGSFFSSEPELHSPGAIDDARLPVFNRLIDAAQLLSLSDLML